MTDVHELYSRRGLLAGIAALGAGAATVSLGGCEERASQDVVLFVTLALGNPFYVQMIEGLRKGLTRQPGWQLDTRAGKTPDDTIGQRTILESLLSQNTSSGAYRLKGLVLVPSNSQLELTGIIRDYNAAKVPVVNLDIPVAPEALRRSGAKVDSFVGSDNVEGGRVAAREMVKRLPKGGEILILMGVPGQANTGARREGFLQGLAEAKRATGVSWTTREWTANWNTSEAISATSSLLASNSPIAGIFAENDLMALGAARAVASADLAGRPKPTVIGYDAIPQAIAAVAKGELDATISQEPATMGEKAIDYLIRLNRGETIPAREIVPVKVVDRSNAPR